MKTETRYQSSLVKKLNKMLPGCIILKNDPRHIQGVPDIIILFKNMWAALEVKKTSNAAVQPNQEYYVDKLGAMSFASFISPETEEDVLSALQRAFGIGGKTCVSKS